MMLGTGALERSAGTLLPVGAGIVALGGGADSALAAHVVTRVRRDDPGTVRAVFVDHRLPPSDLLRTAAEKLSAHLGLELVVVPAPVEAGPGVELRARIVRRAALCTAAGSGWIVTGHTRDDQAETVLGNVLRGAGASGLGGMRPSDGRWIRPLLGVARSDVRRLSEHLGLPFVDDPTNTDLGFRRNRLRHDVIPSLEVAFNPGLRSGLAGMARLLAADDEALESEADSVPVVIDGDAVLLPAAMLAVVPDAVAARAVRRALRIARPPYAGTSREVAAVLDVARGIVPRAQLVRSWLVEREGPMVALYRPDAETQLVRVDVEIPARVRFGGLHVSLDVATATPVPRAGRLMLDPGAVGTRVIVRPAAEGERVEIDAGTKPVREAMAEAGIPLRLRSRWPVVESRGKIAAVVGGRPANWARFRDRSGPVVTVSWERNPA